MSTTVVTIITVGSKHKVAPEYRPPQQIKSRPKSSIARKDSIVRSTLVKTPKRKMADQRNPRHKENSDCYTDDNT